MSNTIDLIATASGILLAGDTVIKDAAGYRTNVRSHLSQLLAEFQDLGCGRLAVVVANQGCKLFVHRFHLLGPNGRSLHRCQGHGGDRRITLSTNGLAVFNVPASAVPSILSQPSGSKFKGNIRASRSGVITCRGQIEITKAF